MSMLRIIAVFALAAVLGLLTYWLLGGGDTGPARLGSGAGRGAADGANATDDGRTSASGAKSAGAASGAAIITTPYHGEAESKAGASWVVTGRVVAKDETPVGGVTVSLGVITGNDPYGAAATTLEARSGDDGAFSFALTPPDEARSLRARVTGDVYESNTVDVTLQGGAPPPPPMLLTVLRYTGAIVGTVSDGQGKPIAGASVGWSRKVTTNESGAYRFPTTTRWSSAYMAASARGFAPKRQQAQLPPGGGELTLNFTLAAGAVIDGTVMREDKTPIAGCKLRSWTGGDSVEATSGPDGAFHLEGFNPEEGYTSIKATAAGLVPGTGRATFTEGRAHLDITLRRGVAVGGVVVAGDGHAISGVSVAIGKLNYEETITVFTGRDGRFAVEAAPVGTTVINATCDGFAPRTEPLVVPPVGSSPVDVRIALGAGHHIAGRVLDIAGKPIKGLSLAPRRTSDNNYLEMRGKTDADGHFRIEGLPEEGIGLEVYGTGYMRSLTPITLDRDDLVITMLKNGRMAGLVVDAATNEPLKRFNVRIVSPEMQPGDRSAGGYSSTWGESGHQFETADGIWRIDDEDLETGGVFGIEVRADGYGTGTLPRVVVSTEPDPKANTLALAKGSGVTGVVVTTRGEAVARAAVSILTAAQQKRVTTQSWWKPQQDAETSDVGAFAVKNVAAGEFWVFVRAPSVPPFSAGPFQVATGQTLSDVRIVEPEGGTVTGVVLDANGAPVVGARVHVDAISGQTPAFEAMIVSTGADGRFTARGLPAGGLRIGYHEGDNWNPSVARTITLAAGETQEVRLAFDGPCSVHVIIEGDAPLPTDFMVSVQPLNGAGATTGANRPRTQRGLNIHGTTVDISGLEAGVHQVSVNAVNPGANESIYGFAQVTLVAGAPAEARVKLMRTPHGAR